MATIAATSEKGTYRSINEDACCIEVASSPCGEVAMAVVCDGVGGLQHGELAASSAVRRFAKWFKRDLARLIEAGDERFEVSHALSLWDTLLADINWSLCTCGRRMGAMMATTFTGVLTHNGDFLVGQVGDSRLYVVGGGTCTQVTQDQTLVAQMVERGELSAQEAAEHPCQNVILQAVGATEELCPVFSTGTYREGDMLVLCTDGIHKAVGSAGIYEAFSQCDARDRQAVSAACDALVERAIQQGQRDNLTVCCLLPEGGTPVASSCPADEGAALPTIELPASTVRGAAIKADTAAPSPSGNHEDMQTLAVDGGRPW